MRQGAAAAATCRSPRWLRHHSPSEAAAAEAARRPACSGPCRPSLLSAAAQPRPVHYARHTRVRRVGAAATTAGGVAAAPTADVAVGGGRPRVGRAPAHWCDRWPRQWQRWRRRRRRRQRRRRRRQQRRLSPPWWRRVGIVCLPPRTAAPRMRDRRCSRGCAGTPAAAAGQSPFPSRPPRL